MIVPTVPPIQEIDEIHDASVIEILPDGNGVSSDIRIGTFGPDQPDDNPYVSVDKLTIHKMKQIQNISVQRLKMQTIYFVFFLNNLPSAKIVSHQQLWQ